VRDLCALTRRALSGERWNVRPSTAVSVELDNADVSLLSGVLSAERGREGVDDGKSAHV
jgi:hypothetical protein